MTIGTGHTPGPWVANMNFGRWTVRQDPKDWDGMGYQSICVVPASRKGTHYGDMFKANAYLIAAAPELLAALKAMDTALCDGFDTQAARMAGRKALIAARAAIAKAEGRS